jgi:Flp pilus assembly pilin Flp
MRLSVLRFCQLIRDRRGFTRLEFSLLTAMLCAMVINGIATLGGGLGSASRPMGTPVQEDGIKTADLKPGQDMQHKP